MKEFLMDSFFNCWEQRDWIVIAEVPGYQALDAIFAKIQMVIKFSKKNSGSGNFRKFVWLYF